MAKHGRGYRRRLAGFFLGIAIVCWAGGSAAQQPTAAQRGTGRVAGSVTLASNGTPVTGAQVFIVGTTIGGLTRANGQYLLVGVPVGTHQLSVKSIGHKPIQKVVTVAAGELVTADFGMEDQVLALDQVVVTGTAGAARRREVGNSISQITLETKIEAVPQVENMLQSASPGLTVMESDGQAGSGKQIRMRGNVSAAMSNAPLIYVDGVRLRSDGLPVAQRAGGTFSSSRTTASPIGDIDAGDIERIEMIKGAAATTLYGTEAAAGVIQIFTKRGRSGKPVFTSELAGGWSELLADIGPKFKPKLGMDPWLQKGPQQRYALTVSGGTPELQYFLSGSLEKDGGIIRTNRNDRNTLRANLTVSPIRNVFIDWNTSMGKTQLTNYSSGNNTNGLETNVYRAPVNYVASDKFAPLDSLLALTHAQDIDHFVSGVTIRYQPSSNWDNRLTFGTDRTTNELITNLPFGYITEKTGHRTVQDFYQQNLTADFGSNYRMTLFGVSTTLSGGGQWVESETRSAFAWGDGLPGPGAATVTSAAVRRSQEDRLRVVNAGFFGQTLFGIKDRYFLTFGLRLDGNSAFGKNMGLQFYPKTSGSWVISDEKFWPKNDKVGSFKLRAAYGFSGRAPGAFDAVRTWTPVGWGDQGAFWPGQVGNADLGPERTGELELGADLQFFNERLSLDITRYDRTTTDALVAVRLPPSGGFNSSQLMNVGEFASSGLEVGINAKLLSRESLTWDVGLNLANSDSKVVSIGDAPGFSLGANGWVIAGQPLPVIRGDYMANLHEVADPIYTADTHFYGPSQPTKVYGVRSSIGIPGKVTLSGQAEYMGGNFMTDRASRNMATRGVWAPCQGPDGGYAKLAAGQRDQLQAWERKYCVPSGMGRTSLIVPADFVKIRNITLEIPVTGLIGRFGGHVQSARILASVRNLPIWTSEDFFILDPEMAGDVGANSPVREITEKLPSPQQFAFSLRVVY